MKAEYSALMKAAAVKCVDSPSQDRQTVRSLMVKCCIGCHVLCNGLLSAVKYEHA